MGAACVKLKDGTGGACPKSKLALGFFSGGCPKANMGAVAPALLLEVSLPMVLLLMKLEVGAPPNAVGPKAGMVFGAAVAPPNWNIGGRAELGAPPLGLPNENVELASAMPLFLINEELLRLPQVKEASSVSSKVLLFDVLLG